MNGQEHTSGQVQNQNGAQMPVVPQQNGVPLSSQMQNTGNPPDLINARGFMQRKIFDILMRRHQPTNEIQAKKLKDIVRLLEEGLFRNATSKEEYINSDTLESRLNVIIKRQSTHSQSFSQHSNAPSVGTMIPTPGWSNGGNTNVVGASSGDTSVMSTEGNNSSTPSVMNIRNSLATGNTLSHGLQNAPFTSSDGFLSNSYQSGNNMVSYMGLQRITSQMIPTPGFSGNVNQSSLNMESTNDGNGFTTADTGMLTQQQQQFQKQRVGGQNSRILHTLGSQIGRQQKQFEFSNGALNGGLGMTANNIQNVNDAVSSEGFLNPETFGYSSKVSHQNLDQSQQSLVQDDLLPSLKRIKTEQSSQAVNPDCGDSNQSTIPESEPKNVQVMQFDSNDYGDVGPPSKSEFVNSEKENHVQENPIVKEVTKDNKDDLYNQRRNAKSAVFDETAQFVDQEIINTEKETVQPKQEIIASPAECMTKSGKPKIKGVSLTELFTLEQVIQHIDGLRQWVGKSKAKAEKNQAMEHIESSCQLCAVGKLTFEPPPTYCTPCGMRIKRNAMYYTVGAGDTQKYFCIPCYNDARGGSVALDGNMVPKSTFLKKKNDEETEEWWVQCDKCEAWQHQICALFNGRRNDGGQAEYTCPYCYIKEIEQGERMPLPQSSVFGAKDLPRTILSDHIEQRLFKRLKWERQERAGVHGKSYDEVPSAEALVVRVVSSVDKKLEVKPKFLEMFQEENYPREFPYKSKLVLLFQKIEGVEVCLFGMYVQEFGAECQQPNQRRVYLSYLDSVKYFRPEIKAVTGEALRTFVYHEILIGYLEYCKKRGFTSCYIWACPPLKGDDYILYCHPEIQKTPRSDKLREWYLSMLQKATKESIVVDLTNLYDHFFTLTGECKAKVTAARLPYFDGDYWPGAAEDMIFQIQQEEEGRKMNKKGSFRKTITKRALKASGHIDLSANAAKDLLLMHKLGGTISPLKEDFIMVHLQYACTHCCALMVNGNRWACSQCKNFQLCDKCFEAEQEHSDRERHPVHHKDKHNIYRVEITDVPLDTKDTDEILESEYFDTRQTFLSLCQKNHYQYDTLRRAKHSSMMVLYHLHNPTAPAFVTTCNVCLLDLETGQGWHCEVCPEYDVCNSCYQKGVQHQHKLAERDAQNQEARQQRVIQLRKKIDLLMHASQCRVPSCQYPNCLKGKGLYRHSITCKTRAPGGCGICRKMWHLLRLHAQDCKESECSVPRCRDLKLRIKKLQQQSDSRRRAAVMEMMRQRAAEVAGNSRVTNWEWKREASNTQVEDCSR